MATILILTTLAAMGVVLMRHIVLFPAGFARLLAGARQTGPIQAFLLGRSSLRGAFRGRPVTVGVRRPHHGQLGSVLVAVRVDAPDESPIQVHAAPGALADRELERSLFALEATHQLRVSVAAGWLRAIWQPATVFPVAFPGRFDPTRWRDILAQLHFVAGRLESRSRAAGFADMPVHAVDAPVTVLSPSEDTSASEWAHAGGVATIWLKLVATLLMWVAVPMLAASAALAGGAGDRAALAIAPAILGGLFLATGAASHIIATGQGPFPMQEHRVTPDAARNGLGGSLWILLIALLGLPVWMVSRLAPLASLWQDMLRTVAELELTNWRAVGGDLSGIVLLPLMAVFSVPALETAVACGFIIGAYLLVPLLVARRPAFPRAYVAFGLQQAGLAGAAQYASHAALRAGRFIEAHLPAEPESAVVRTAITRYGAAVTDSADTLMWVALGFAAWIPVLLVSRRAHATFARPSG